MILGSRDVLQASLLPIGTTTSPEWRGLLCWRQACPGRSRRRHPLALWAGLAKDLATRGFVQMCLRLDELVSLRKADLLPPIRNVSSFYSLLIFREENRER